MDEEGRIGAWSPRPNLCSVPDLRVDAHLLQATTLVDLLPLAVVPKAVAPVESQEPFETRKVWEPVINALNRKDYNTASKEKQRIEQEQRDRAEERKKTGEVCVAWAPEPQGGSFLSAGSAD